MINCGEYVCKVNTSLKKRLPLRGFVWNLAQALRALSDHAGLITRCQLAHEYSQTLDTYRVHCVVVRHSWCGIVWPCL
jgi:hypothetical protein